MRGMNKKKKMKMAGNIISNDRKGKESKNINNKKKKD